MQSTEAINGVDVCFETFGEADKPTVLLVAGMASSMDWSDTDLCEQIAADGRFVVRYDLRDTGQSATCPPGEPDYSWSDLVDDAAALLDHREVERARVVGMSMGGALPPPRTSDVVVPRFLRHTAGN